MSVLDMYDSMLPSMDDHRPTLSECIADSMVESEILDTVQDLLVRIGFERDLSYYVRKEVGSTYHVIESNVGDDANVTTDSFLYGLFTLCAATHISFIKLSMKDIGISKSLANYAEGWMLTPPTANSSFEAVNRFNKGFGLAFTLDPVKLKLLSAVRKQSSEEMDLESKLMHLAEIAAWTDRSWFTYDFHQMSLLLANCVFDFNDARSFPFLYKTEGGSGGLPPYGNLATAYSALHYYTRGKSRRAILGIMQECVAISHSEMRPKDSYFLRASHLANAGDPTWARYESAYRTLLKKGEISRGQARELLHSLTGTELNPEIMSRGFEINPEGFVVGSAIGHLRDKGYLMTEVDVKLLEQQVLKSRAVFGKIPIGEILSQQEEEATLFKSSCAKILTELYTGDQAIRDEVDGKLGSISRGFEAFSEVAEAYYRLRSDLNAKFTSFFYTDSIRVFKTEDIRNYFGMKDPGLAQDFGLSELIPRVRPPIDEFKRDREERELVNEWLESGDLNEVLSAPLPTGIGTDDSRIIKDILAEPIDPNIDGYAFVILTDDSGLLRSAAAMLKARPWASSQTAKVCQVRRNDYTAICLQGVREAYELRQRGISRPQRLHEVPYYNYIMDVEWMLPNSVVASILSGFPGNWRRTALIKLSYDVPNLERGLERTVYRPETNTVVVLGGGHLSRLTTDNMPRSTSWASLPISTIAKWDDFSVLRKRVLHARDIQIRGAAFVAEPKRINSTRDIRSWIRSLNVPLPTTFEV
nr:hypothetical protein [Leptosphaeria biglobosa narnavirus 11]